MDSNGIFHYDDKALPAGSTTISVQQYSPIFVCNGYGYEMTSLVNCKLTSRETWLLGTVYGNGRYYLMYYTTSSSASATQPTD